jgi:hypothetical protein
LSGAAALLFLVAGGVVVLLIFLWDEPFEAQTWRALGALRRRAEAERETARAHVTFVPFAWRVVRGGQIVRSLNPRDVSGVRVVGGETLTSHEWKASYNNELVEFPPLEDPKWKPSDKGGMVH